MLEPKETNTAVGVDVEQHPLTKTSVAIRQTSETLAVQTIAVWVKVETKILQIQCALKFHPG